MKGSPYSSIKKTKSSINHTPNASPSKIARKISPANYSSKISKINKHSQENTKSSPNKDKIISNNFQEENGFQFSDHSIPESAVEDEKSTKVELKRIYDEFNETLLKTNKDSEIILKDMKELLEKGIEAQSVTFSNNKIKREVTKLKENLNKTKANNNYLNDQRNSFVSIDVENSAPIEISNAIFELNMENSLMENIGNFLKSDISEIKSKIQILERDLQSSNGKPKKNHQFLEEKAIQSKINQFKNSLQQIKVIKTPSFGENTSQIEDVQLSKSLIKARGLNSMLRRFAFSVQSNLIKSIADFEDISEKCSIIWPKLNGFKPDDGLMEQFMNEMWEQAALSEQIQTLHFHLNNILHSADIKILDDSIPGLIGSLNEALQSD